jgi:hypothetical protein
MRRSIMQNIPLPLLPLGIPYLTKPGKPYEVPGYPLLSWISIFYGTGKLKRQSPAGAVMMNAH